MFDGFRLSNSSERQGYGDVPMSRWLPQSERCSGCTQGPRLASTGLAMTVRWDTNVSGSNPAVRGMRCQDRRHHSAGCGMGAGASQSHGLVAP